MRTRKVIFVLLLIAVGLLLIGCSDYAGKSILPASGKNELTINFLTPESGKIGIQVQIVGTDTVVIGQGNVFWYYDVAESLSEYAAQQMSPTGDLRYVHVHLHISKKPPANK